MPHQTETGESLSSRDFARISELIYAQAGISLGVEKKTMVEVRLKRRLRTLNMESYRDYCEFVFSRDGMRDELVDLINVITTNKTDFFREPAHFDYLAQYGLNEMGGKTDGMRPLLGWSAGCSSGEEPYTLAMVMSEFAAARPGFRFRILATDISTVMLEKARAGIYTEECAQPIPLQMRRKYLLRSRDGDSRRVRIVPELRHAIEFRRLNLMDAGYGLTEKADFVFCRNVLIYFNRATQESILRKLVAQLVPGGYVFVGHSETLHDMNLPIVPVAPALTGKPKPMPEIAEIYLQPGEWELVRKPAVLKTVLGSCVGITFRAPRFGIGAMCHPMLPKYAARINAHAGAVPTGRYVDSVIGELAREFEGLGARPGDFEVKLFGGADVLASSRKNATVGKMNGDMAVRVLQSFGFRPIVSRLGGSHGVFIEFHTSTGEVLLRRLKNLDAATLART